MSQRQGFTLIELSIVLVIIGLITGGILVGRDLISSAQVRAQIAQVEKYSTAVNTFKGKYGYLPGDIPEPAATQYGFKPRGSYPGQGDGNGVLEGNRASSPTGNSGMAQSFGETGTLWGDLSRAGLIEGDFSTPDPVTWPVVEIFPPDLDKYLPKGKLGRDNYVYAYSNNHANYFGVVGVMALVPSGITSTLASKTSITTQEAFAMDSKVDDGFPQTGRVNAQFLTIWNNIIAGLKWSSYWIAESAGGFGASGTAATVQTPTTCYDNGGVSGAIQRYSVGAAATGTGYNCALSFQFQ